MSLRLRLHHVGPVRLWIILLVSFQSCIDTLVVVSHRFLLGYSICVFGRLDTSVPTLFHLSNGLLMCLLGFTHTIVPSLLLLELEVRHIFGLGLALFDHDIRLID